MGPAGLEAPPTAGYVRPNPVVRQSSCARTNVRAGGQPGQQQNLLLRPMPICLFQGKSAYNTNIQVQLLHAPTASSSAVVFHVLAIGLNARGKLVFE
jgi:hypothetical protein